MLDRRRPGSTTGQSTLSGARTSQTSRSSRTKRRRGGAITVVRVRKDGPSESSAALYERLRGAAAASLTVPTGELSGTTVTDVVSPEQSRHLRRARPYLDPAAREGGSSQALAHGGGSALRGAGPTSAHSRLARAAASPGKDGWSVFATGSVQIAPSPMEPTRESLALPSRSRAGSLGAAIAAPGNMLFESERTVSDTDDARTSGNVQPRSLGRRRHASRAADASGAAGDSKAGSRTGRSGRPGGSIPKRAVSAAVPSARWTASSEAKPGAMLPGEAQSALTDEPDVNAVQPQCADHGSPNAAGSVSAQNSIAARIGARPEPAAGIEGMARWEERGDGDESDAAADRLSAGMDDSDEDGSGHGPVQGATGATTGFRRRGRRREVDSAECAAFHSAARGADHAALKRLIASGLSPDMQDGASGRTALMVCSASGDVAAVELLLDGGASIHLADDGGMTALHHAIKARHDPVARLLLSAGSDVDAADGTGDTLLLAAIEVKLPSVVKVLLDAGADIELASPSGETPLMRAARLDLAGMVRELIRRGCDVRARDGVGDKAFDVAVSHGSFGVTRLLLRADPVQRADRLAAAAAGQRRGKSRAGAGDGTSASGVKSGMDGDDSSGAGLRRGDGSVVHSAGEGLPSGGRPLSPLEGSALADNARLGVLVDEAGRLGADPEDDDDRVLEFELAFGLPTDVWDVVKRFGLQPLADRLANIESLRSSNDFNRIGRRELARAGLSPREVFEYAEAVRQRLHDELFDRASVHQPDVPLADSFAWVGAVGRLAQRSVGTALAAVCCGACTDQVGDPRGFGAGVEERAVATATPEQREAYRQEMLRDAEMAAADRGFELLDEEDEEEGCPPCCCCVALAEDELEAEGLCGQVSRVAIRATGGVVADAEGIEFLGEVFDGKRLGSTATAAARLRMQRHAAAAGHARRGELVKRHPQTSDDDPISAKSSVFNELDPHDGLEDDDGSSDAMAQARELDLGRLH